VLEAAKALFVRRGIDRVTIAEIAKKGRVAPSTVYALFKSKEGILRALMQRALFGQRFRAASAALDTVSDPIRQIELTAGLARAIYESESADLGLMRGASAFSPSLRKLELEFERMRFEMQKQRLGRLFAESLQNRELTLEEARRILFMYTSRDVYRMLVNEGRWSPARYQEWLAVTLLRALVAPSAGGR
jgi:AcrR family transcriptional regulator